MPFPFLDNTAHLALDGELQHFCPSLTRSPREPYGRLASHALTIIASVEGKLIRPGWLEVWKHDKVVYSGWFGDLRTDETAKSLHAVFTELVRYVADHIDAEDESGFPKKLQEALTKYLRRRNYPLLVPSSRIEAAEPGEGGLISCDPSNANPQPINASKAARAPGLRDGNTSESSQFEDLRERAKTLHEEREAEDHHRWEVIERLERCREAYQRLELANSRMCRAVEEARFQGVQIDVTSYFPQLAQCLIDFFQVGRTAGLHEQFEQIDHTGTFNHYLRSEGQGNRQDAEIAYEYARRLLAEGFSGAAPEKILELVAGSWDLPPLRRSLNWVRLLVRGLVKEIRLVWLPSNDDTACADTESRLDPAIQAILDKARAAQDQATALQRAHQEAQARCHRAYQAWLRVSEFKGDAIPPELTGDALHWRYAELVVDLGQVLKTEGWQDRVDAVQTDTEPKIYALAMLRKAMEGDIDTVRVMVRQAINNLYFGIHADGWLRGGLMYEVLNISPPPEPPLGWEGPYLEDVKTVEDFIKWIDGQFLVHQIATRDRADQPSDGQQVRNAFRLVMKLGLKGMPLEPTGPFKLNHELAVLRNLWRLCVEREGQNTEVVDKEDRGDGNSDTGGSSKSEGKPQGQIEEGILSGEENQQGITVLPQTAEAKLAQYLRSSSSPNIDDAEKATGLTRHKIWRTLVWQEYEEKQLDEFLRNNEDAQLPDVNAKFGWKYGKISGMEAWEAHQKRKAERKTLPEGKERQLHEGSLNARADETASDPQALVDARDALWQRLIGETDSNTRGQLIRLNTEDQERLLTHLVAHSDSDEFRAREPAIIIQVLLEVARSWLDEEQQDRRRRDRLDPRR